MKTRMGFLLFLLASKGALAQNSLVFPLERSQVLEGGNLLFTGIAVANPSGRDAEVKLRLLGPEGKELAPSQTKVLRAFQQLAVTADTLFNTDPTQKNRGWISAESNNSGVTGFFLVGDTGQTFLDGADVSYRPLRTQVFPEVRNGAGAFTEFYFANPSATARDLTLQVFSASGEVLAPQKTINIPPQANYWARINEIFPSLGDVRDAYVKATCHNGTVGFELFGNSEALAGLNTLDPTLVQNNFSS
ncbi:MAG: hypothetical protein HY645_15365 [Acidobacteria bacterium]|nr:hypothetical protein [Acidobacteriota bacterium]